MIRFQLVSFTDALRIALCRGSASRRRRRSTPTRCAPLVAPRRRRAPAAPGAVILSRCAALGSVRHEHTCAILHAHYVPLGSAVQKEGASGTSACDCTMLVAYARLCCSSCADLWRIGLAAHTTFEYLDPAKCLILSTSATCRLGSLQRFEAGHATMLCAQKHNFHV